MKKFNQINAKDSVGLKVIHVEMDEYTIITVYENGANTTFSLCSEYDYHGEIRYGDYFIEWEKLKHEIEIWGDGNLIPNAFLNMIIDAKIVDWDELVNDSQDVIDSKSTKVPNSGELFFKQYIENNPTKAKTIYEETIGEQND